jgi:hypothetical protein
MMRKAIEISTSIGCRNNCSYCPQKTIIQEYRKHSNNTMMSMDTFRKCIENIPSDVIVTFSGFAEPFLNPNGIDMILSAYYDGHPIQLYTTLVGLKVKDIFSLNNISFDCFTIHLPSISENFFNIGKDKYLNILELVCISIHNISFVYFSNLDDDIKSILDKYGYMPLDKEIISRSGLIKPFKHIKGPGFCPLYININIILPDGEKVLCCMDYRLKHIIKDGEDIKSIKRLMFKQDSDLICRDCEFFIPYLSPRYPFHIFTELLKKLGFNYWEYRNGVQRRN